MRNPLQTYKPSYSVSALCKQETAAKYKITCVELAMQQIPGSGLLDTTCHVTCMYSYVTCSTQYVELQCHWLDILKIPDIIHGRAECTSLADIYTNYIQCHSGTVPTQSYQAKVVLALSSICHYPMCSTLAIPHQQLYRLVKVGQLYPRLVYHLHVRHISPTCVRQRALYRTCTTHGNWIRQAVVQARIYLVCAVV